MLLPRKAIVTPLIICVCILGVVLIQLPQLQKLINSKQSASLETLEKEIKSEKTRLNFLQKIPGFGYDNFIADLVYLSFLQYFGDDEIRDKTGYSLSPEYFEVILERDPRFLAAYRSLSISTSLYAAMPERAIALSEKGLKSLSPSVPERSYYIWRYKGVDELLFLGNAKAAQQSFATAANWASKFSDPESQLVANTSQRTAEFLSRNPNSKYAQISTWSMVLNNQVDERTQKRAIKEIEALGGKVITTPEGNNKIVFPPKD
jgi:preprotein translocase subunit SecG